MRFEDLDTLLDCLDEKDIMERYYGESIKDKKAIYRNPLRNDCKGTCSFFRKGNRYYLKDFSNGVTVGCFDLVMHKYNCTYYQAKLKVTQDFGLTSLSEQQLQERKSENQIKIKETKSSIAYQYITREYNNDDVAYWSRFGITIDTLKYFNIRAVSEIRTYSYNANRYLLSFTYSKTKELAYVFEFGNKNKFYRPMSKLRDYKWFGNTTSDCVYGLEHITEYNDTLIIGSGPKDMGVLREVGYNCIAPMSESNLLPDWLIDYIKSHFRKVYVLFDTDRAGLQNGVKYAILYGFTPIWIPKEPKVKDVAEYAEKHGLNKLYNLIETLKNGNSTTYTRASTTTTTNV